MKTSEFYYCGITDIKIIPIKAVQICSDDNNLIATVHMDRIEINITNTIYVVYTRCVCDNDNDEFSIFTEGDSMVRAEEEYEYLVWETERNVEAALAMEKYEKPSDEGGNEDDMNESFLIGPIVDNIDDLMDLMGDSYRKN